MDALNDIIRLIDGYRENVKGLRDRLEHQESLLAGLQWRRLQPGTVWKHRNKERYAIIAYRYEGHYQKQHVRWFLFGDKYGPDISTRHSDTPLPDYTEFMGRLPSWLTTILTDMRKEN